MIIFYLSYTSFGQNSMFDVQASEMRAYRVEIQWRFGSYKNLIDFLIIAANFLIDCQDTKQTVKSVFVNHVEPLTNWISIAAHAVAPLLIDLPRVAAHGLVSIAASEKQPILLFDAHGFFAADRTD
jgi:hypothetical protein